LASGKALDTGSDHDWIPAFAGMTSEGAGMTANNTGPIFSQLQGGGRET